MTESTLPPEMLADDEARAASVPRGLAFHLETALTQARLAYRIALYEALDKQQEHLASVIEQLEEMALKLKAGEGK